MHPISDFRSDTVTRPGPAMREAMMQAAVGDDVLGDDPTVNQLEAVAAQALGKEAALFCPSGVMANQIAVRMHTRPGDEVICEAQCHTYINETGGLAALSGVQVRPLSGVRGLPAYDDVLAAVQEEDVHHPRTRAVLLENTHNYAGGCVIDRAHTLRISDAMRARGIAMHLDGARLGNAAVASKTSMAELSRPFDTVTLCLSKGLGAPVGSMLASSADCIREARRIRKMFGGGMRQAGILAAAGLMAMTHGLARLHEDHARAARLAHALARVPGITLDPTTVETNIVYFTIDRPQTEWNRIEANMAEHKVLLLHLDRRWRMVTHLDVDDDDVERAVKAWGTVLA